MGHLARMTKDLGPEPDLPEAVVVLTLFLKHRAVVCFQCVRTQRSSVGWKSPLHPGIVSIVTRVTARLRRTAASQTTVGQRSDPEPPCSSVSSQSIQLRLLTSRPELHPHPNRRGSKAKGEQQAAA